MEAKKAESVFIDTETGLLSFQPRKKKKLSLTKKLGKKRKYHTLKTGKRLYTDLRFHTPDGRAQFGAYTQRDWQNHQTQIILLC